MRILQAVAVIAITLLSGCAVTTVREHPNLEDRLNAIDSVVIAPAAVTIAQANFNGENERLTSIEESIRDELQILAQQELEKQGFDVVDFDFQNALDEDEEFAYAVTQVREDFSKAKEQLYKTMTISEGKKRSVQASVSTAVNMLAERSNADAVLLMHYSGIKKSAGLVTKDVVVSVMITALTGSMPIPNKEASAVEVALIDGVTGDVLWTNIFSFTQISAQGAMVALKNFPEDLDPEVEQPQ